MIDREQKMQKARELYMGGYNCAQAVFTAFAPETGMDESAALRLSSGFGAGIGGMRGVCGALSGMTLALGVLRGYDTANDLQAKKKLYARVQAMFKRFTDEFEDLHCKALLARHGIQAGNEPSERTPEYYLSRPCVRYIEACAGILADELNKEE